MSANPGATVLMSVFDGARYLRDAVQSVLAQTYADFELLVVDDGSTDGSAEIVASYPDPRIRLARNAENLGLAASLNRGMELARGAYIARMDCDDIALPERLSRQLAFLEKNPEVGACGSWIALFGEADRVVRFPTDPDEIKCNLFFWNVVAHPTVVLRRDLFRRHGLRYREELKRTQDYDLWVRASRLFPVANVGEVLLRYRVHGEQAARRYPGEQRAAAKAVWLTQLEELGIAAGDDDLSLHFSLGVLDGGALRRSPERIGAWIDRIKDANASRRIFPEPAFSRFLDEWVIEASRAAFGDGPPASGGAPVRSSWSERIGRLLGIFRAGRGDGAARR